VVVGEGSVMLYGGRAGVGVNGNLKVQALSVLFPDVPVQAGGEPISVG